MIFPGVTTLATTRWGLVFATGGVGCLYVGESASNMVPHLGQLRAIRGLLEAVYANCASQFGQTAVLDLDIFGLGGLGSMLLHRVLGIKREAPWECKDSRAGSPFLPVWGDTRLGQKWAPSVVALRICWVSLDERCKFATAAFSQSQHSSGVSYSPQWLASKNSSQKPPVGSCCLASCQLRKAYHLSALCGDGVDLASHPLRVGHLNNRD